jgi:hypothetical protein
VSKQPKQRGQVNVAEQQAKRSKQATGSDNSGGSGLSETSPLTGNDVVTTPLVQRPANAKTPTAMTRVFNLFPKSKFIMNNKQLNYSSEKDSICFKICRSMGLVEDMADVSWWERYKDMIADVLNPKRADVSGGLKHAFICKSGVA